MTTRRGKRSLSPVSASNGGSRAKVTKTDSSACGVIKVLYKNNINLWEVFHSYFSRSLTFNVSSGSASASSCVTESSSGHQTGTSTSWPGQMGAGRAASFKVNLILEESCLSFCKAWQSCSFLFLGKGRVLDCNVTGQCLNWVKAVRLYKLSFCSTCAGSTGGQ